MKKTVLSLIMILIVSILAYTFSACDAAPDNTDGHSTVSETEIRAVYTIYTENGGDLPYEEWLASVKGKNGVGITSIEKTKSEGNEDTYTITLTDGTTSTFIIKKGRDKLTGKDDMILEEPPADPNEATPDKYFNFTLLEDDTYAIYASNIDLPSRIVLPATYNGKAVTAIGSGAFEGKSINEVIIPSSVSSIGGCAFCYCLFLTSVTIPKSVTHIGDSAFEECRLTSIYYEGDLKDWCDILGLFGLMCYNSSSKSIYFKGTKVENLVIPDNLTSIPSFAFYNYHGLTSVTFAEDNNLSNIGHSAFDGCTGLTSISIPEGVTSIGDHAFSGCRSLTSLTLPNSLTSIGEGVFSGCSALISITLPFIGPRKGAIINSNLGYIFDRKNFPIYDAPLPGPNFYYCYPTSLTTVIITGETTIPMGAFTDYSYLNYYDSNLDIHPGNLSSVTLPESVKSIEGGAFYGCGKLTSIVFQGTKAQWDAILKEPDWDYTLGNYTVHCTDGDISKQ